MHQAGYSRFEAGDYESASASGEIRIPVGQTQPGTPGSPTPLRIEITGDGDPEPNETFELTFSATGATVTDNTATGTVLNDDGQVIAISDVTVDENVSAGSRK